MNPATNRVRELLENQPHVEEKNVRGITFMVNDKCVLVYPMMS